MDIKEALASDEGKAAIAAAVEAATSGLKAKIEEFKVDKQRWKEERDAIEAEKQKAEEEAATKSGDIEKIKQQLEAKHKREMEAATNEKNQLNANLHDILVEKGISEALAKNGIAPQLMDAAKALIKTSFKPEVVSENGSTIAKIDGKTVDEFISGWSQGDNGKHFKAAPANGGGGAGGSNGGGRASTGGDMGGDRSERTAAIAQKFPDLPRK